MKVKVNELEGCFKVYILYGRSLRLVVFFLKLRIYLIPFATYEM